MTSPAIRYRSHSSQKTKWVKNDGRAVLDLFSFVGYTPYFFAEVCCYPVNRRAVWSIRLVFAVRITLGAWVGARTAVERGAAFVRWVLIAVVAVSGAKLLGVFDWVGGLF